MSGHCEKHCSTKCQGSVSVDMTWHMADAWVRWGPKRRCPFCEGAKAERELLLAELDRRIATIEIELAAMSGENLEIYDAYRPVAQAKLHALRSVAKWIEGVRREAERA